MLQLQKLNIYHQMSFQSAEQEKGVFYIQPRSVHRDTVDKSIQCCAGGKNHPMTYFKITAGTISF